MRFYKLYYFADKVDIALMVVGTISAIGNGLSQPVMTLFFGQLVNSFGGAAQSNIVHVVSKVSLKFVYLGIAAGVASFLQVVCWMVSGERQAARIRGLYLKTIMRQDIEFFDTQSTTGEVIGRMCGDTILIQEAMGDKVGKFLQFGSTFLGGFVIAFNRGWLLSVVLCSSIIAIVIVGSFLSLINSKMANRGQDAYAQAGDVVEQTVGAITTVQSYSGEKKAVERYGIKLRIAYASSVKQGLALGVAFGVVLFIVFSTYGLAIWYGAKLIIHKGYSGGVVVNVIMSIMTGGIALGQVSPCLNAFAAGEAAGHKMFETIERTPKIDAADTRGTVLEDLRGEIELKDVHFRYPARPEVPIFSGFSLKIPCGKTVALVGQSGSGKSTVISLLERFYDPEAGQILIDGVNLKNLKLKWMRQNMGLVSQEPILFATTIKENILYGKTDATEEEIRRAVEVANAAGFIDRLPQGVDSVVGEHGSHLSGGQKQRIAIARAILKNPKILLLDEATSALDAESEHAVQEALDSAMKNRTTVVVAHRLATIRTADIIAVLHSGKLIEEGTHDELMRDPDGAYTKLFKHSETAEPETNNNITSLTKGRVVAAAAAADIIDDGGDDDDGAVEKNEHIGNKLLRLAYLNKPELPYLLLGSAGAGFQGLIFPIFGLLLSTAIRIFFEPPNELRKDSEFWALMMVVLGLCCVVAIPIQYYCFGIAGAKLVERIRSLTFKKVVHQQKSWFDDPANSSGSVGARLSSDASTVASLVGGASGLIVQNMFTIIGGLVIAFTANWLLTIITLAVLPLVGLQGLLQIIFSKLGISGDDTKVKSMYGEATQIASDAVSGIRTVASFDAEEKVMTMYKRKCEAPLKQGVRVGVISGASFGVGSLALYCTQAFCFYIGSLLIQHGKASFGDVFKVFFALTMSATGISQACAAAPDINKVRDSADSIFEILDSEPEIDSSSDQGIILANVRGDVELRNISFKYPTRPQLFRDLSLTIPSGMTVALVGESGSGKSTVISLIERFYNPESGKILLDGVEIERLKLRWLRQQIGLVSQEPVLFNDTIRENIAYGKDGEMSEEEMMEATKAANAHNFISGLPQGYNTRVGERGVQLSGGQKQRIAIARAIVKNPKILLLDEATSALDAESENIVKEALDRVMVGRTTVVVAHRLTTIIGAHIIAVVGNGAISEMGSHDELIKIQHGAYASLLAINATATH
ncbi:P-glycoprotein 9 [Perilla frutescens var. hirtella]|nr:P-glycoprotein 9 [Perilla frutescens var. hirtella]